MNLPIVDMDKFRSGDDAEYEKVFNFFFPILTYFVQGFVVNRHQAQDLAIQIMEIVWFKIKDMESVDKIKSFVFKSAKNRSLNEIRNAGTAKKYIAHMRSESDFSEGYEEYVLERMIKTEVLTSVWMKIEELPDRMKLAAKLRYKEGLPYNQIAQLMGTCKTSVKTHVRRAEIKLKDHTKTL